MEKQVIVSRKLHTEAHFALIRHSGLLLDQERQRNWGLTVEGIWPMKQERKTEKWKQWLINWKRNESEMMQNFDNRIHHPKEFLRNQKRVIAASWFSHYLAAYTCIASDKVREVIDDLEERRKEAL